MEEKTTRPSRPRRSAQATTRRPSLTVTSHGHHGLMDLSWKDGGSTYPKSSSRVGSKYQATNIPSAGSVEEGSADDSSKYCEQIWDPVRAEEMGANDFVEDVVPYNKKEQALATINASNYSLTEVQDTVQALQPMDGSSWTKEEKEKFNFEIFRLRKDMKAVSRAMNKPFKTCLAYYLGTYKKSDHYRWLKTVCVEERLENSSSVVVDACGICGDGGSLLICDGCEGEYHMGCLQPRVKSVPEGNWECDECVDRKLLEARNYIIRNSNLYEQLERGKKRGADDRDLDRRSREDDSKVLVYRPRSPVMEIMKKLAINISDTLEGRSPAS